MSEEPKRPEDASPAPAERTEYAKTRRPFSKLAVELDPDDLSQKGTQKLILSEISRLESEVVELRDYETRFHLTDKECGILKAKREKDTTLEVLYTASIAVGSALLGWLPSSTSTGGRIAIVLMAFALLAFALIAKWRGKGESK